MYGMSKDSKFGIQSELGGYWVLRQGRQARGPVRQWDKEFRLTHLLAVFAIEGDPCIAWELGPSVVSQKAMVWT